MCVMYCMFTEMVDYAGPHEPSPQYEADSRSRKGGYSRLPMYDYPPEPSSAGYQPGSVGYEPYPPAQPMPAPVVQQQQSSNTVGSVLVLIWFFGEYTICEVKNSSC